MPELPDVETFRKYLDATALHQHVADVAVREKRVLKDVSARDFERAVKGRQFEATDRHGKYLFVHTSGSAVPVLHFGMTGLLAYEKEREPQRYDRVVFGFENRYSLAYQCRRLLGRIALAKSPAHFVQDNNLGPDALQIGREKFVEALRGAQAAAKSCLMDQERLAGIGNIYSDEILFQSRMSPKRKADTLSAAEAAQLYRTMRRVLTMAIERRADPARMPASWLLPHRNTEEPCPRCRGTIARIKVGGRSAYWCPRCQAE
jgi:formamidopyrimidine-DNA glycosylase